MLNVTDGVVLADRYVVGHKLGAGGSGAVWQAHDRVLDRPVAVKVVPEGTASARLAREARAAAGIGVSNVVAVYDVGEQDGAHFLVMELVRGVDLATLVAGTGPLPPELVALVGREIARGLAAVHGAGLVHRDVSPANVLVTHAGEVKLTDLGIAQRTGDEATRRLTEVGTVVGTVDYLAPEQVEGNDVTAASDVYALGLLLHACATGRAPFGDGSVSERLARRLASAPAALDDEHGALVEIVRRATSTDPADRYADGEAMALDLQPLVPDKPDPLRAQLGARVDEAAETGAGGAAAGTEALEGVAIGRAVAPPPGEPVEQRSVESTPARESLGDQDPTMVVPTAGAGARAADGRSRPSLVRPIAGAIVGVLAVVLLLSTVLGGDGGNGGGGGTASDTPLTITAVVDHDPLGGGGEHGDAVGRVIDGDTGTEWDTEGYDTAALGGLKSGVGLLLDLGATTDVAAVELDLGLDGVDVTVTVSEEAPVGDPTAEATVLGSLQGVGGTQRIEGDAVNGRWVAVWFTSLAPDGGRFRASVREARVYAG